MPGDKAEGKRLDAEPAEGLEVKCTREEQGSRATQLTYELRGNLPPVIPTAAFIEGLQEEFESNVVCTEDGEHTFRILVLRGDADDSVVSTVDECIRLALKAKLGADAEFQDQDPQVTAVAD